MTAIEPSRRPAPVNAPYLRQAADRQALERLIEQRPPTTDVTIGGAPVRLYFERPRIAWGPTLGRASLVAAVALTVLGGLGAVLGLAVENTAVVAAVTVTGGVLLVIRVAAARRAPGGLRRSRHGAGCGGLHCPGCGGRR